ncbi:MULTISPECIES: MtnX-like HAD-IB family phosphatase [Sporomusa]|uniref:MtnX-like HAD-IB family phosphatase n=1 Tax=Sporomusa TaxID=2375 RepID=UPI002C4D3AAB|nr:MtnX-like HAD-IB family phosphatase [Sporomusa sphaeroides]HML34761.1 MtnX-like HAD-IB family phosphatase [Sporomusa sphaeroides]
MRNLSLGWKNSGSFSIICDFDNTITSMDTTDALLSRFASPEWEEIERQWVAGHITARECMAQQIGMLDLNLADLHNFLDKISLAKGFKEFIAFVRRQKIDLTVVSDGLDYVIRHVLARHGLQDIPIIANQLRIIESGYELAFPHSRENCGSGVCKCAAAASQSPVILIGDGCSDFCLASRAALVLAKRGLSLEAYCRENSLNYLPYDDFYKIIRILDCLQHSQSFHYNEILRRLSSESETKLAQSGG